jgi:hypothetical protein
MLLLLRARLQVYSMPLVGVWVKGPSSVLHPLVAAACLRFAFSSLLADRAVNPETGAFLLLLCPEGEPANQSPAWLLALSLASQTIFMLLLLWE